MCGGGGYGGGGGDCDDCRREEAMMSKTDKNCCGFVVTAKDGLEAAEVGEPTTKVTRWKIMLRQVPTGAKVTETTVCCCLLRCLKYR